MMQGALQVEDLTKRYEDVTALDEVSLRVEPGECVVILGPNGAGKSTLMACVATLTRPSAGQVAVGGVSIREDAMGVRRRLGVAFQEPIASKHLTGREVLEHHARLYGVPRGEVGDRSRELLAFVGLVERAGDRVATFSGGMKRRLDLARVLMTRPEVLLLDEPTGGLDPRGRAAVQDRLRALSREGTTLLVATHDLEEAERLADRVVILDQGRVVGEGKPGALVDTVGDRVVRVSLGEGGSVEGVQDVLTGFEGVSVRVVGDGVEAVVARGGPSSGRVVEALEGVSGVEEVVVGEPGLGDVFLSLTGERLVGGSS